MKKKFLNACILSVMLLTDFVVFAGEPDDTGDGPGGVEGDDAQAVPINGKLIWLLILGIAFAFYAYKNYRKSEQA